MDDAVRPFPIPEMTPPETKMYFNLDVPDLLRGTINTIKLDKHPSTSILSLIFGC